MVLKRADVPVPFTGGKTSKEKAVLLVLLISSETVKSVEV
jgi:hypothetical protein